MLQHLRNRRLPNQANYDFRLCRIFMWVSIVSAGLGLGFFDYLGRIDASWMWRYGVFFMAWLVFRTANFWRIASNQAAFEAKRLGLVIEFVSSDEAHKTIWR